MQAFRTDSPVLDSRTNTVDDDGHVLLEAGPAAGALKLPHDSSCSIGSSAQ